MTAQKTGVADTLANVGVNGDVAPLTTLAPVKPQTRANSDGFSTTVMLSAIGMGLAMQSATNAGETALQEGQTPVDSDTSAIANSADVQVAILEGTELPPDVLTDLSDDVFDATLIGGNVTDVVLSDAAADLSDLAATIPAFAPRLDDKESHSAGEVPIKIATNATLSQTVTQASPHITAPNWPGLAGGALDPTQSGDGAVDSVLDPIPSDADMVGLPLTPSLGDGNVVDSALNPILGDDGLVDTILDPILGDGGVVDTILDPILGDGGLVDTILDPILGDGGLVDTILDPILGDGGLVDTILDPILGDGGVVDTILDPILGDGGVVDTLLDPILGDGGIVDTVLDPVLGDGGVVDTLLDPILGDGGVLDAVFDPLIGPDGPVGDILETVTEAVIDPVLGSEGVLGTVLDPLLGDDGALGTVLDPLLGEDGIAGAILDPLLDEGGAVGSILDPIMGEDGPLGGLLAPVVGSGGLVDSTLSPVLDNLGPVGGLVSGILGGFWNGGNAAQDAAANAVPTAPLADDTSTDTGADGTAEDGGFIESLIGLPNLLSGADSYDAMADMLSVATDPVLDGLLFDDPLAGFDPVGLLPTDDGLLSDMLGLGLTGALMNEGGLLHETQDTEALPDPETDSLLSEILDSGERMVSGVTDPLAALLDIAPDTDDVGADFGSDMDQAVEGALQTLIADVSPEVEVLGSALGEGGLLGGLGLFGSDDEHS